MNFIKTSFPFFFFFLSLSFGNLFAQSNSPLITSDFEHQKEWVDSIYNKMSLEEKVGQLFMVDVFSRQSQEETEKIKALIEEYHPGGVIFSKGGPQQQAKLTNEFQEHSQVPLMIGMDAEWGLAMRLDSTHAFPYNMTLGAIRDPKLIEDLGAAIAKNVKRMGVHINFAPVVDINTNPLNPIIGNRSFGENKENVSQKSLAFIKGMQRENILSSAKHFPGHGDTETDSHKTLPKINFLKERIEEVELFPYRQLIEAGLSSIMVGHLEVPALEKRKNLPSSFSKSIVTDLLKNELEFHGLIITDALGMEGAAANTAPGEASLKAFLAGNDLLLMPANLAEASQNIRNAYNNGLISEERLQHSVRKILFAKYKAGLNNYKPIDTGYLVEDLNSIKNDALEHELFENAITVIKNNKAIIPVKNLEKKKIAYVNLGSEDGIPFYNQLSKYGKVDWIKSDHLKGLSQNINNYNLVIVGFHKSNKTPWDSSKFSERELVMLNKLAKENKVILTVFTSPYALLEMESTSKLEGIIIGYQNNTSSQQKAAQLIFGAFGAKGVLPVSIGNKFSEGIGFKTEHLKRLSYGLPENVGVNSYKLKKIDSLINRTIKEKMSPGVQVLVARKGKVIYNKSAGYHTYEKENPVIDTDVYDLASLTKIIGTLPLIMELVDQDELDLGTQLSEILPGFINSNKKTASLQQMLSHYAKLKSWIPFYRYTFDSETKLPSEKFYRDESAMGYNTKVAEGMYLRNDYRDSIINVIKESDLEKGLEYKYSDLPYYLLKFYLEKTYGTSLNYLTQHRFFRSLGANYTTYLPLNRFPKEQIIPTENDKKWRKQLLHGYVHDEGAALLGGVGGHAGIYGNANDVAKIMQMYLNGGEYGGKRFFRQETIDKFNTCYYCQSSVRRGVGFDKPQLKDSGPTCGCVSMSSFGHSGFTGTFTWADPHEEIVYVFLSNRIHPSAENNKLGEENIRAKIQEIIYEAIDY